MVIEKNKNTIMIEAGNKLLNIKMKDIEQYLSDVKEAVETGKYRIDRNAKRQIIWKRGEKKFL